MSKHVAKLALFGLFALSSCEPSGKEAFNIPMPKDLKPGGVYVSYNMGCDKGCDQIQKGDLIQSIDGKTVKAAEEFDQAQIADGKPHKLALLARGSLAPKTVEITAHPKNNLPPLKDTPPFWTVSAEKLNQAPEWARRRMFGHASPMVQLVSINGGITDGRQLYGKKRLMVYWDWADRIEQANAISFMQVLQKAGPDLAAKNVEVMMVHTAFPSNSGETARKKPMNDTDLRAFADQWAHQEGGKKLPMVPMYRRPNKTEFNAARELGLENAYTVMENLGDSPAILILDERGIVRWHSEALATPPADAEVQKPDQYTIIEAVKFSLEKL